MSFVYEQCAQLHYCSDARCCVAVEWRRIPRSPQSDDIIFSVFSSGFILELRYDNIMTGRGQGYSIAGIGQDQGWTFWSISESTVPNRAIWGILRNGEHRQPSPEGLIPSFFIHVGVGAKVINYVEVQRYNVWFSVCCPIPGRLWWERATNSLSYVDCHYEWWSWD